LQDLRAHGTGTALTIEGKQDIARGTCHIALGSGGFRIDLMSPGLAQKRGAPIGLKSDHHGKQKLC
jgi:hypothetical protein